MPMAGQAGSRVMAPSQKGLVLIRQKVPQPAFEGIPQVPASEVARRRRERPLEIGPRLPALDSLPRGLASVQEQQKGWGIRCSGENGFPPPQRGWTGEGPPGPKRLQRENQPSWEQPPEPWKKDWRQMLQEGPH